MKNLLYKNNVGLTYTVLLLRFFQQNRWLYRPSLCLAFFFVWPFDDIVVQSSSESTSFVDVQVWTCAADSLIIVIVDKRFEDFRHGGSK